MSEKQLKLEMIGIPPFTLEIPDAQPMIPKLLEDYIEKLESENTLLYHENKQLKDENEQLRMRLSNCEQKKSDGDFQVCEVPQIPEEERISFITKYGGDVV